ncbi:MAG TPA: bifunctional nicotinamidase/pyrazinamidase [Alphaproteobacteria bacterium]|nr:bifunctional nicotinamidase/pyrazinamidase [Alphaproteobacteria bacterium]
MTSEQTDVLLAVDIQNDFCTGGALAVPDGDAVVPVANRLLERFDNAVITQDWHPPDHHSFASQHSGKEPFDSTDMPYGEQTLWPDHCVQGTDGAGFHPHLLTKRAQLIVRKGFRSHIDSYSAFFENDQKTPTGLTGYLRERGLTRLTLLGLAYDVCVQFSALDARRLGFEVTLVRSGCRAIDMNGSADAATRAMTEAGVNFIDDLI